jgi:tetratricopeptide (TPR) repeat protein
MPPEAGAINKETLPPHNSQPQPPRRKHVEITALALLLPLAAYVWSAPILADRALAHASLPELVAASHKQPHNPRVFSYLGMRYRQAGSLTQAEQAFAQAAQLGDDTEATWLAWATVTRDINREDDAFTILSLYLKQHPGSARAHYQLALQYQRNDAHKRTWEEAAQAAKCDAQYLDAWRLAGEEAMAWGQFAEAEKALQQAVALAPQDWRSQMDLGTVQAEQKQNATALAAFHAAARLAPSQPLAQLCLGRALLESAHTPAEMHAARIPLQQAIILRPTLAPAHLLLGQSYATQERWSEAAQELREAERLDPNDPETAFSLAGVYRRTGDAPGADREASRHQALKAFIEQKRALISRIEEAPEEIAPRLEVARLCAAHGQLSDASYFYRSILARDPNRQEARSELAALQQPADPVASVAAAPAVAVSKVLAQADTELRNHDLGAAQKDYLAAIAQDKTAARAYEGAGVILSAQGRSEDAFLFLEHAVKLQPGLPQAEYLLSQRYRESGFPGEAARRMKAVVQAVPDNPDYWLELGKDYGDTESTRAEDALQHAVALAPHDVTALLELADRQADNWHKPAAEKNYRQAVALAPQSSDALSRLAGFLLTGTSTLSGQQESEDLLRQALKLQPNNDFALFVYGRLELARNHAPQAVGYLKRVVEVNPNEADAWYALSRACERSGNHAQAATAAARSRALHDDFVARVHAEELIRLHPQDMAQHCRLAQLCARRGESARALMEYQIYLKANPGDASALKERDRLTTVLKAGNQMPSMNLYRLLVADIPKGAGS